MNQTTLSDQGDLLATIARQIEATDKGAEYPEIERNREEFRRRWAAHNRLKKAKSFTLAELAAGKRGRGGAGVLCSPLIDHACWYIHDGRPFCIECHPYPPTILITAVSDRPQIASS